jgi:hypothetical protein
MDALGWLLKSMGLDVSQIDLPEVIATVKTMAEKVAQFEAAQNLILEHVTNPTPFQQLHNELAAQGIILREILAEIQNARATNLDAPIERSNGVGGGSRSIASGASGGG